MCLRVVERYSVCGCIYYSHSVDPCEDYAQHEHSITVQTIRIGDVCLDHAVEESPESSQPRHPLAYNDKSESKHRGHSLSSDDNNSGAIGFPAVSASTSGTCYEPLTSVYEIRLLHLAPGKQNEALFGKLQHVNLESSSRYEALSYEWGSSERKHYITLQNGLKMPITESLNHALRDIRYEDQGKERIVWADAISINQDDLPERQKQVSMMGTIYRKAARVITYIGPENRESSSAVEFAQALMLYHLDRPTDPRAHFHNTLLTDGLPPAPDPRWTGLKALLLRGWSSRCWCAQEYLLNERLIMMCGRKEVVDCLLLPDIVQLVFNRELPTFLLPQASEDPNSLRECLVSLGRLRETIVHHKRQLTLFNLLEFSHPFRATDPRDKIYALLGLASDREDIALAVDYSQTVEQVYITTAIQILNQSASLSILYNNLNKKAFKLPSWVPDWSTWQFGSHGMAFGDHYSAHGPTVTELRVHPLESKLEIAGCLFSRVTSVSTRIGPHYQSSTRGALERKKWVEEQMQSVQCLAPYPDGSDIYDVFWRTLIGNTTLFEDSADADYKRYFEAHLVENNSTAREKEMAREFCDAVRRRSRYRRLAVTANGYFGAIPENSEPGDWTCMLYGGPHVFVLRESGPNFVYIGHAYVHGVMSGEIYYSGRYKKQMMTLV